MPHVTFIHGIANKVEPAALRKGWLASLRDSGGPDLLSAGVTVSMCYWADVLYPSYAPSAADSMEAGEETEILLTDDVGRAWFDELPSAERLGLTELAAEFGAGIEMLNGDGDLDPVEDSPPGSGTETMGGFERIPLPGPLKRKMMRALLRDVHHYLWNVSFTPRPGDTYLVRDEVRARALAAIQEGANESGPHIVVGHSLGSVIAYDVLQNLGGTPTVDGMLTLGSPLGIDEVQDRLNPGWSRRDGFPSRKVRGTWVNVYDRLDPVCGLDPKLANDFRQDGTSLVQDVNEPNWGAWRHAVGKYLHGDLLRNALRRGLVI